MWCDIITKRRKNGQIKIEWKFSFFVDPFRWEVYWSEATTQSKITLSHNWISSIQKQVSTNSFWCNRLKVRHLWQWLDALMKPPPLLIFLCRSLTSTSQYMFFFSIEVQSIDGIWLNKYSFVSILSWVWWANVVTSTNSIIYFEA